MRCHDCLRSVAGRAEWAKRIEARLQTDGTLLVFGIGMPDGTLDKAVGRLVWVKHSKCFHARAKALARLAAKQAERAADPGHRPRPDSDYRDQDVREIGELPDGRPDPHAGHGDPG